MDETKNEVFRENRKAKKFSFLKVGFTSISSIKLPIIVLNGSRHGPTLGLTAGIHGCEYSGIEAVIRVVNQIDPKNLSGRIIAVPVVNMPAFQGRVPYICPIDGINLNRIFPGNSNGSISYRLVHSLFSDVISKCDFLIDLHGADLLEELPSQGLVILQNIGNRKIDQMSRTLANLFDAEYVLMNKIEGSCIREACKKGIPAIAPETDGAGKIEEKAVLFYLDGILNVLKYLKMIEGSPKITRVKKEIVDLHPIRARLGGLFYPKFNAGDIVSKGEIIGEIKNLKGNVIEQVKAYIDGVILVRMTYITVNSGDILMVLGKLKTKT